MPLDFDNALLASDLFIQSDDLQFLVSKVLFRFEYIFAIIRAIPVSFGGIAKELS
jgi:hypothetical protein